jgi:hypothetical protein
MSKLLYGDSAARLVSERIAKAQATVAALKSIPADKRVNGQVVQILADNTLWQWVDAATAAGDDVLAINPSDSPATGRWMRMPGRAMLKVPFYATTPSGTSVLTVPSNTIIDLDVGNFGLRVSRIFTGVATALAGLSSRNHPGHTGAFDFIGSCVATQLNASFSATAAGTGIAFVMAPIPSGVEDVGRRAVRPWLKGGDTLRQDGGGWGTGIGEWLVSCNILQNPGV